MENPKNIFFGARYAEIRIDLAKNFPVTVYGDNISGKKSRKAFLADVVSSEDLPLLISQIESVLSGKQTVLQAHARIKSDNEDLFFLIRCSLKKEKFGKAHLEGFVFDVSAYLEFAGEDRTLLEYKRKTKEKTDLINNHEIRLINIVDIEYLQELQAPLAKGGVFSAIYDENENLICSSSGNEDTVQYKKFKHLKRAEIKISRVAAAFWVIAAPSAELITENEQLFNTLVQAVTRIANSFVVLYNEMHNSENANKLLSQHIEQQILINNIYNIILELKDAGEALEAVIKLVGEYMGMRRICVYDDFPDEKVIRRTYQWRSVNCADSALDEYSYPKLSKVIERLEYTDMYLPPHIEETVPLSPEACTAANLNGDGRRFGIMSFAPLSVGYVPTPQESKVLRSVSQITATLLLRKKADEKLIHYAFYDRILGIPNRARLDEDLSADLAKGTEGAVAVVKITNLHTYNELFGQNYTDGMLRDTAQFISDMSAANLTVYRFSGNTLMLLLRETDEEYVKSFIEKLLTRFGEPWKHEDGEHYLDAGIGVTLYPNEFTSLDMIYRSADLALYKATEYGTNSYAFYSEDFKTKADTSYTSKQNLRCAIIDGMKGFILKYQPVIDLDGKVLHYEVFVSRDGLPTPKLIQLAENTGLDIIIDSWVLKTACAFCKKMQEYEPEFSVSVNITSRELRSGSIIGLVTEALSETGLDGEFLSLEIPERAFSDRQDGVLYILKKLRDLKLNLVIDSFGSDYGGLRLLKHSLLDMVKVDYNLFTDIFGEFDEIWVNTVSKLASSLKNGICVKLVEDELQLEQARKFGVKYAQGFLYSKPVSAEEISKKLQKMAKQKQT
ncbi:MAG: bifunctional diguanylate cyclase/phosphodiesterase [Oscillospiraceae bacterium]|nr:bifunctional diguanylate cyclase/phosphodiesterase [Oscillospiraceae bacterium]